MSYTKEVVPIIAILGFYGAAIWHLGVMGAIIIICWGFSFIIMADASYILLNHHQDMKKMYQRKATYRKWSLILLLYILATIVTTLGWIFF